MSLDAAVLVSSLFAGTPALFALPFDFANTLTHEISGFFQIGSHADWVLAAVADWVWLAQGADAAPQGTPVQAFFNSPLPLFAGLAMIWYLTWFLPEKRKRQEEARLLASI